MPERLYSARVQCRLPGVETTEIEVHMATYSLIATAHRRQVPHRQHKFTTGVRRMHKRHLHTSEIQLMTLV